MSNIKTQTLSHYSTVDHEEHLKELCSKFARLVRNLGFPNGKGTVRHQFEVDFAYAQHEVTQCPPYLRAKMLDKLSNVIANLVAFQNTLKTAD